MKWWGVRKQWWAARCTAAGCTLHGGGVHATRRGADTPVQCHVACRHATLPAPTTPRAHAQVPEPFKIHEASEAATERSQRMLSELQQERMAECTFHPKTNEASSKQLLKRAAVLQQSLEKGR